MRRTAPAPLLALVPAGYVGPVRFVATPDESQLLAARSALPRCPGCSAPLLWYRLADLGGSPELHDRHARAARIELCRGASVRDWFWICDRCNIGHRFDPSGLFGSTPLT